MARLTGKSRLCVLLAATIVLCSCASDRLYSSSIQRQHTAAAQKNIRADLRRSPVGAYGRFYFVSMSGAILNSTNATSADATPSQGVPLDCRAVAAVVFLSPDSQTAPAGWQTCSQANEVSAARLRSQAIEQEQRELATVELRTVQFSLFLNALFDKQEAATKQLQGSLAARAQDSGDTLSEVRSMRKANDAFLDEMKGKLETLRADVGKIK